MKKGRKKKYDWPGVEYHSAEWWRLWRAANSDSYAEYRRDYQSNAYKVKPEQERSRRKKWASSNPEKIRAHQRLRYALLTGKIERLTCSVCGAHNKVHAHHEDYSKPLEVVWLCPLHHAQAHKGATK